MINLGRIRNAMRLEAAAAGHWRSLSGAERAAYTVAYPGSKFSAVAAPIGEIKHPGKLHRDLGIPEGEHIPEKDLDKAKHSRSAAVRKEANFAKNARKWRHA